MERMKIERQEEKIESKTIKARELLDLIYQGKNSPQDNRFLTTSHGGVFKYFDPRDLQENVDDKFYSFTKNNKEVVALAELEKNPDDSMIYWIKFLSVDPKYQGNGYASILVEEIFKFAKERGITLEASAYTDDGQEKLKAVINRLAEKFSVKFIDNERKI